jgi:hypothetical protein
MYEMILVPLDVEGWPAGVTVDVDGASVPAGVEEVLGEGAEEVLAAGALALGDVVATGADVWPADTVMIAPMIAAMITPAAPIHAATMMGPLSPSDI